MFYLICCKLLLKERKGLSSSLYSLPFLSLSLRLQTTKNGGVVPLLSSFHSSPFFHSLIESLSKMRRPWSVLSFSYPLSNNICNFCLSYLLMGFTCYRQTVIISLLSLDVLCLTLIKSSSFRLISLFLSFTFHLFFLCLLRFPMENLS